MQRSLLTLWLGCALAAATGVASAQGRPLAIPPDRLEAFAKASLAIDLIRDKARAELAEPKNKKDEVMTQLREKLHEQVAAALAAHGLTAAEFEGFTFVISADTAQRRVVEEVVARLTKKPAG